MNTPDRARPLDTLAAGPESALELRARLGVPEDAERVLIFGETSHWDPNWLRTTEEYYESRIRHILDEAIDALNEDSRRVFSIECIYFLRMYFERNPERQERLRQLLNEGRLRLTGSGVTTPDVTLPDTEAILRDYLLGQEWLRQQGVTAEPRLAYLPDDFGYTPALPSILRALGMDQAGITRIDGMYFVGSDFRPPSSFPLAGSSAASLINDHCTQDFVWRAPDGAEVLTHWNAFTYFQGDLLGHLGIIRWMGRTYGTALRSEGHVARQIKRFVKVLAPLTRTPYLFCPIGCDFNGPIPALLGLLDRYNKRRYPVTGTWAVNAGLDDYLTLVDDHREKLPVLAFDPNPYWTGFYSSRPLAKRLCNRISRKLVLAERLATHDRLNGAAATAESGAVWPLPPSPAEYELREGWDHVVLANHHDYITGTSPDRVWLAEQQPWLEQADALSDEALAQVAARTKVPAQPKPVGRPEWKLDGGRLEVNTPFYRLVLDQQAGGCITSYVPAGGEELLTAPAFDLVVYRESGGLWRMGHEYPGGHFREKSKASQFTARILAHEENGVLEVQIDSELDGRQNSRWLWLRADAPGIRIAVLGEARRRTTVTCRFPTRLAAESLIMDVPGGAAKRPRRKLYDPTFWSCRSFAHIRGEAGDGLAAFLGGPAALSLGPNGVIEWVALRNANREIAWRILPLLAHPARGTSDESHRFTGAVRFTPAGDWRANRLPHEAPRILHRTWCRPGESDLDGLAERLLRSSHPQVVITAFKVASRGTGFIVRLSSYAPVGSSTRISVTGREVRAARLCDALERDGERLPIKDGAVLVPLECSITSVRVAF